jgi:hypothetical protein
MYISSINLAQIKKLPKKATLVTAGLIAAFFPFLAQPFLAMALSDVTAPAISNLQFTSASTVDVSDFTPVVNISANITDDISGFSNAHMTYTSPSGKQSLTAEFALQADGTYATGMLFPQYAEGGNWVPQLTALDNSGNSKTYTSSDFQALGLPSMVITITGVSDTTAPIASNISLTSAGTVDVSDSTPAVSLQVDLTDDLSNGITGSVTYTSPSGSQSIQADLSPQSGDTFSTGILFPRYAESGQWKPSMALKDNAGNHRTYTATDLAAMNSALNITVTGTSDTVAPVVNSLSFSVAHPAVEAPLGGAVVTMAGQISDNLSGLRDATVYYTSPTGQQSGSSIFFDNGQGALQASVTIPSYAESGTWQPKVVLDDNAGNSKTLTDSDLKSQGVSLDFDVSKIVKKTLAPGDTITSDEENDGATALDPVEASVTSPVAGDASIVVISSDAITDQTNGYTFFGKQIAIVAPTASVDNPLSISFQIDSSKVPQGQDETTLQVVKNGQILPACTDSTTANPDACVYSRTRLADGDIKVSIHSTTASLWEAGFPTTAPAPSLKFTGFVMPVKNPPTVNKQKAGSTLPVAFGVTSSNNDKNILAAKSPSSVQINCSTKAVIGSPVILKTANNFILDYRQYHLYQYNWKTDSVWAGTCRQLDVALVDGSHHTALFQFSR